MTKRHISTRHIRRRKYTSAGKRKPSQAAVRMAMTHTIKAFALVLLGAALFALLAITVMQGA